MSKGEGLLADGNMLVDFPTMSMMVVVLLVVPVWASNLQFPPLA
jgi:hypothetical protein